MNENKLPTFDELMNPLLQALQMLGGSGSIEEIYAKTVEQVYRKMYSLNFMIPRKAAKRRLPTVSRGRALTYVSTACLTTPAVVFGR